MSWHDMYDTNLFSEISDYINEPKETYWVISIGIEPAVALYNDFYCLDGYSNNYNVEYKHQFGLMENSELEKNQETYDYFWNWGNRYYLYPDELNRNTYISKEDNISINWDVDVNALKNLGADYLFSAVQIDNASALGFVFEKYFVNAESYRRIYLYSVE